MAKTTKIKTTKKQSPAPKRNTSVNLWPANVDRLLVLREAWQANQSDAINQAVFACWLLHMHGGAEARRIMEAAGKMAEERK